jgi:hypothetical protein
LLYYAKHNGLLVTALLRVYLALRALALALGLVGRGEAARARRAQASALLRLAFGGDRDPPARHR